MILIQFPANKRIISACADQECVDPVKLFSLAKRILEPILVFSWNSLIMFLFLTPPPPFIKEAFKIYINFLNESADIYIYISFIWGIRFKKFSSNYQSFIYMYCHKIYVKVANSIVSVTWALKFVFNCSPFKNIIKYWEHIVLQYSTFWKCAIL